VNPSPPEKPSFMTPPKGVQVALPDQVPAAAKRLVDQALAQLPKDQRALMVQLTVETKTGKNLAVAYQTGHGLQAALWAGKNGWDQVVGVSVAKVWK